MTEWKRQFVKVENPKGDKEYAFIAENDTIVRTEEISKKTAKEEYDRLAAQHQQTIESLQAINKKLKGLPEEVPEEIKEFIRKADLAAQHSQKLKLLDQRELVMKDLQTIEDQKKDMENVIPELKRKNN